MKGEYTTIPEMGLTLKELSHPVEGLRSGWNNALCSDTLRIHTKYKEGRIYLNGYLNALYVLRSSSLPGAYCRSLPIARFQFQIEQAIAKIERMIDEGSIVGKVNNPGRAGKGRINKDEKRKIIKYIA